MPKASISELLVASPLMRPNERDHQLSAARELHVFRDDNALKGKVHKGTSSQQARSGGLGAKLSKLMSARKGSGRRARLRGGKTAFLSDPRQRVVATVFYQSHGGGAAGRLIAHASTWSATAPAPMARRASFMTAIATRLMRTRASRNGRRRTSATSA